MHLILLSNGFPYGSWEPYLETEIQYLHGFDDIHLCAMQVRREHMKDIRPLPDERFHVCPVPFAPLAAYFPFCFFAFTDRNFYAELIRLLRLKQFSFLRLAWLLFYIGRSHHEMHIIRRYLKKAGIIGSSDPVLLYSYRFDYQPYAALLLKKYLPGAHILARGHRYDLYENMRSCGYIPMRPLLLQSLDCVVMISQNGIRYLQTCYPKEANHLLLCRLGSLDHGIARAHITGGLLRIVSCSTVTPVKRVHLIAQALAQITDFPVEWTHFGDGPLLNDLKSQCAALPHNIRVILRGFVPNNDVMREFLQSGFHLFLNVSSSEGIPVSIMEALSFGLPCIATEAGGTGEIVTDGNNGILLPVDFAPADLASYIRTFASMDDTDYQNMRKRARSSWEENYNADTAYTAFNDMLITLAGKEGNT